jgi:hypothetical protein
MNRTERKDEWNWSNQSQLAFFVGQVRLYLDDDHGQEDIFICQLG